MDYSTFPLTVFKLAGYGLEPVLGCPAFMQVSFPTQQFESTASALYQLLADDSFVPDRGQWFLDSRYSLTHKVSSKITLREDRITRFHSVTPLGLLSSTSGLFYVGREAKTTLMATTAVTRQKVFDSLLVDVPYIATKKRYPFPVILLTSDYDVQDMFSLKSKLNFLYPHYGLSIETFKSVGSIVESHRAILSKYPENPVLVIDADFEPNGSLALMTEPESWELDFTHLWYVDNPLNGLVYGHGGPKLISTRSMDLDAFNVDMTTSTPRKGLVIHPTSVGTHAFNSSPGSVYRTAAREIYKLALKGPNDLEAASRLSAWVRTQNQYPGYASVVNYVLNAVDLGKTLPINDYVTLTKELDHAVNQAK